MSSLRDTLISGFEPQASSLRSRTVHSVPFLITPIDFLKDEKLSAVEVKIVRAIQKSY